MLGVAGLFSLSFGFQAMFIALIPGGGIALAATRSVIATTAAIGVHVVGASPNLWNGTTIGWAILLLLVSRGNRPPDAADHRLVRYFAGPRADF